MLLGICLQPDKLYHQTVKRNFRISQATLELANDANDTFRKVWVKKGTKVHLIACLSRFVPNAELDLDFTVGEKVTFYTQGANEDVYLEGFYTSQTSNTNLVKEATQPKTTEKNPVVLQCNICNLTITNNRSNFKRHMKLHEPMQEVYVCNLCGQVYQNKYNFNVHHARDIGKQI
ncbi:46 kDa FK506-binding nuclear protein-like [Contarinia nasturtii]|uniref:46 kDa FK506-binding nuclear protein-like n=1 Tax=Contarinia nasturtii TaxID=265458 RepID=UPI0012D4B267|nr:46 kDa FK506-binding nuclear protein-like [Contarinia nasturtii]